MSVSSARMRKVVYSHKRARRRACRRWFTFFACVVIALSRGLRSSSPPPPHAKLEHTTKVLVTHWFLPSALRGGDHFISSYSFAMADLGWDVTWLYLVPELQYGERNNETVDMQVHGVKVVGPIPLHVNFLRSFTFAQNFDMIFQNYYAFLPLFTFNMDLTRVCRESALSTKVVAVIHDDFRLRTLQEGDADAAELYATLENITIRDVDAVVTVNSKMTRALQKKLISRSLMTLTFTYDYMHDKTPHVEHVPWSDRVGLLYIAADNPTNRQSLAFLCKSMKHRILARSDMQLQVYGTVPKLKQCENNRNVLHGGAISEANIKVAARKSRLFVVPCLSNVGISTKIIRFLSVGLPVVSTPMCTAQMPDSNLRAFPVLESSLEQFIHNVHRVYSDEFMWNDMLAKSKQYIEKHYSKHALQRNVETIRSRVLIPESQTKIDETRHKKRSLVWDVSDDVSSSFSSLNRATKSIKYFSLQTTAFCDSSSPDVYIQWVWPLRTSRPTCCPAGKCILIYVLAWEFGHIPKIWSTFLKAHVDYIWTLSTYSANMFDSANLERSKIEIMPLGVECPTSQILACPESTVRSAISEFNAETIFLYVGGLLPRKGVDKILDAWCNSFNADEKVLLILKLTYSHGGEELLKRVKNDEERHLCAKVLIIETFFDDINCLYELADVLIHPARAEGFGLTPLEALAHGLVVIYNEHGATAEYLSTAYAVKVKSNLATCNIWPCKRDTLCVFPAEDDTWEKCEQLEGTPFWYEPDEKDLSKKIRDVHQRKIYFKQRALYGKDIACDHFSWDKVSEFIDRKLTGYLVGSRILSLKAQPIAAIEHIVPQQVVWDQMEP